MGKIVLLIDDNAIQAATRQEILRRVGYFVLCALNPVRALEQLRDNQFQEEPALIITDHLMPSMNGAAFVRELRGLHPRMPVLVISGMDEAEEQYKGLNVTFRMKPLLPESLIAVVGQLLQHYPAADNVTRLSA